MSNVKRQSRLSSMDMVDGIPTIPVVDYNLGQPTVTTIQSPSGFRLAQQMTIAGSFLDFALFVADVEHLKFLFDAGEENIKYYKFLIRMLILSLALQLIVVVLLVVVGFRKPKDQTITTRNVPIDESNVGPESNRNTVTNEVITSGSTNILNHIIICLVTIIAIVNVFVTVFGDRSATTMIEHFKRDIKNHTGTF